MGNQQHIERSFIGSGIFYLNGKDVGNVSAAKLAYDVKNTSLANNRGGGGDLESRDRINSVSLDLTITNLSHDNLAMALGAAVVKEATGDVSAEPITISTHTLADTAFMIDKSKTVVVKDDAGAVIPAIDANGDANYEVTAGGILFKGGTATVAADGKVGSVAYSKSKQVLLQALKETGKEYKVVLNGINDNNGDPHVLRAYRWKPSPTDGLDFISDDYSSMSASGKILADVSKPIGKSQFFELLRLDN